MTTIDPDRLAGVTGGIFYGQPKSETGERWAASFDAGAKRFYDRASQYVDRNVVGLAMLPALAVGETGARAAGHVVDALRSTP
jgi:hypothetical protein